MVGKEPGRRPESDRGDGPNGTALKNLEKIVLTTTGCGG